MRLSVLAAACLCGGSAFPRASIAQTALLNCTAARSAAQTQTLTCTDGVTIVAENGAQFTLLDRDRNGRVDAVDLASKAVLVKAPKQTAGRRFQVLTPQAIAAVRGTQWAVDAEGNKTSVFVETGRVGVSRRHGGDRVTLGPGEGVDVDSTSALDVKRWGAARVAALMARLGR